MAIEMAHRERFLTALRSGIPDKLPLFDLEFNEASIINIGRYFCDDLPALKPLIDYTPEETQHLFDVFFKLVDGLDLDAANFIFTTGAHRLPDQSDHFEDDLGVIYRMSDHGDPFPVDGPIKTVGDLERLRFPPPDNFIDAFRYWKKHLPDKALVFCVPGPFKLGWSLMGGMEKLLLAFAMDQSLCLALSRLTTEFIKSAMQVAIAEGTDAIILDGDIAGHKNTFMSPDHYRRYLKPFHQECVALAHLHDVPIIKHSDGNFWKVMDDLLEIGFDGLHPIQPQCMEIGEVKQYVTGRACLVGNIDCAHLLPFGTQAEVVTAVKDTIRKIAPGGGYILSSSNSIHPGCNPANVVAMFRTARQYGTYPIAVE